MTDTTVDLGRAALQHRVDVAENRLVRLAAKVGAMLPRAETRAHQNDLLDLTNLLAGKDES